MNIVFVARLFRRILFLRLLQLEKKEKMIQEKAESNAQLTQELQRCQKELEARKGEINRKDLEVKMQICFHY